MSYSQFPPFIHHSIVDGVNDRLQTLEARIDEIVCWLFGLSIDVNAMFRTVNPT